jgi:hypothetical protein
MFASMLLTISIVALSQFALYYWRAVLSGVAAQPVSDRVLEAAQVANGRFTAGDFAALSGLHDLTPELFPNNGGLTLVRLYYRAVDTVGALAGSRIPSVAAWSDRECIVCARFAAVQIDRRLEANRAMSASLRSC